MVKVKINKTVLPAESKETLKKAVTNVKHILQRKKEKQIKKAEAKLNKVKKNVPEKKKRLNQNELQRGIVYIGHVPHGFYEEQMTEYFKQFGHVTRIRLARSKKTGKSRGYGYIEFRDPEVAKIAAETMNNYLMCGRLVKTNYIAPDKQHDGYFTKSTWNKQHYPKMMNRAKEVRAKNANESPEEHKIFVKKSVKRLKNLSKKLKAQGIDLTFNLGRKKV